MLQFLNSIQSLRLDIVGFLAILGEGSILANGQVAHLSKWSFVPRLIPAPHVMLRSTRPERLHTFTGQVVGSQSGNVRSQLNHVAHIMHHRGIDMPPYTVKCVTIRQDANNTTIRARTLGPLTGLTIVGCAMSIVLLALSVSYSDGMSLLATLLLSALSTLIGIGNKWEITLPKRTESRAVPESDTVIYYPQGSFLIVRCTENVARQIYWAPENCQYLVPSPIYRAISLVGTTLLMFGVIFLANASTTLQLYWAAAYMILNALYWIVAAFPQRVHWDLTSFTHDHEVYESFNDEAGYYEWKETHKSFTIALWTAIALTRSSKWARIAPGLCPNSDGWDEWLREAEEMAMSVPKECRDVKTGAIQIPKWQPGAALTECLNPNRSGKNV